MEVIIKRTEMLDGGCVIDVELPINTRPGVEPRRIFTFDTLLEAEAFIDDLEVLLNKHNQVGLSWNVDTSGL